MLNIICVVHLARQETKEISYLAGNLRRTDIFGAEARTEQEGFEKPNSQTRDAMLSKQETQNPGDDDVRIKPPINSDFAPLTIASIEAQLQVCQTTGPSSSRPLDLLDAFRSRQERCASFSSSIVVIRWQTKVN
ncbi:hypothetical protein AAMO2058_001194600 [Amorphochlora amoebiformis]